jgi:hypothetical protein
MRRDRWFAGQPLREPFEGRITGASSSRRGRGLPCDRCVWLALLVHAQGRLESLHRFCSRESAVLAQVVV